MNDPENREAAELYERLISLFSVTTMNTTVDLLLIQVQAAELYATTSCSFSALYEYSTLADEGAL